MHSPPQIHETAILEDNVSVGDGSAIWDNVHIRHGARLGCECIVGEKTYIAYDVVIGDRVKINAMVYVCNAVVVEDGVMIGAGTLFTNDRFPRATTSDLTRLRSSEPDEHTLPTRVCRGATIGAGCVIGNDLEIGPFAMVGMGSVVTRSVPAFHLAIGNPARSVGCVCRCGPVLIRFDDPPSAGQAPREVACQTCGREYTLTGHCVEEKENSASELMRPAENQNRM